MAEEKTITLHPRRLARRAAKAELDRAGATGYNKPSKVMKKGMLVNGPSKFSYNWRKIAEKVIRREPAKKARKAKH